MDAKPEHNAAPRAINGRINGRFAPGHSGNPGGSPEATRRAFNKRFLLDLAEDWQQHGREVFKRVRRESPAAYLKVCAMLVPREMKLEHSGGVKAMTDEQLEHGGVGGCRTLSAHLRSHRQKHQRFQACRTLQGGARQSTAPDAAAVPHLPHPL